jgi:hypothetical protein
MPESWYLPTLCLLLGTIAPLFRHVGARRAGGSLLAPAFPIPFDACILQG